MPWSDPQTLPFSFVQISAHVPPMAGVYALMDGEVCIHVGEAWNLKGRLLEVAGAMPRDRTLTLIYESCAEQERFQRKTCLEAELLTSMENPERMPPSQGISFRMV